MKRVLTIIINGLLVLSAFGQFAHLWQLTSRTISDPQVTQSGASPTS